MAEITRPALVALIHTSDLRLVLAITGGGSRAIADLLEVPGGSRTLLSAAVPYSATALRDWLGAAPEHYCSDRTARAMAMAALMQAQSLSAAEKGDSSTASNATAGRDPILAGVACTASLASDRPKRGAHRIHVAWQTAATTASASVELIKGRRSRFDEERLAATLVLNAVAEAAGVQERLPLENMADEPLAARRTDASPDDQALLGGKASAVRRLSGESIAYTGTVAPPGVGRRLLFPGAFNPLHEGHRRMAQIAGKLLGLPVEYEISIENVDKPPLDFCEIDDRAKQFTAEEPVWLTRAPTFDRKAALFANTTFIVGSDTIRRIADPRYYGDDPAAAGAAIERIAASGGRFLVYGRASEDRFETLEQCDLPERLTRICTPVPAEQFRMDVSSTSLRRLQAEAN